MPQKERKGAGNEEEEKDSSLCERLSQVRQQQQLVVRPVLVAQAERTAR